ncbi:hypothetical protein TREES_T100012311 [Tupaia chinensis]|uniref:Uncharacterized protein n=1 Tax=Tupaia chinensis TaxID=246437 RepID=L9JFF6_TUPCH|nr:hypothetical protein TREES_T100012311 [Tupaia chinensis]
MLDRLWLRWHWKIPEVIRGLLLQAPRGRSSPNQLTYYPALEHFFQAQQRTEKVIRGLLLQAPRGRSSPNQLTYYPALEHFFQAQQRTEKVTHGHRVTSHVSLYVSLFLISPAAHTS